MTNPWADAAAEETNPYWADAFAFRALLVEFEQTRTAQYHAHQAVRLAAAAADARDKARWHERQMRVAKSAEVPKSEAAIRAELAHREAMRGFVDGEYEVVS